MQKEAEKIREREKREISGDREKSKVRKIEMEK